MVVKQFSWGVVVKRFPEWVCDRNGIAVLANFRFVVDFNRLTRKQQIVWVLYGQASRAISIG